MHTKELWTQVIQTLSKEIERAQIITWFKNTAILSLKDGVMTVGLPLPFFLNWHAAHLAKATLTVAQKLDPSIQKIDYEVDLSLEGNDPRTIDLAAHFPEKPAVRKLPNKNEVKMGENLVSKMFNPRYTLDRFIVSPENRLAHAACLSVAKYSNPHYNPLFIYGGVGLGKTHLLQGAGQEILRNDPTKTVLYVTSEAFVNDVVTCIQNRNMERLRHKYRKVDALLIDDIQFIANKDRCQEEFFHTFNALHDSGRQIILTSDQPPHELKLLSPRLTSRFQAGMIVETKLPDFETRLSILQERCHEAEIFVNPQVLEFIATNADESVRLLEGILHQAIAKYELEHIAPTVRMISEIMRHTRTEIKPVGIEPKEPAGHNAVTLDQLIHCVAEYYTIPKEEVVGESRVRECMIPRQVIMYLAKTKLRMSLAKIGQVLGGRNHTTVMHAVSRMMDQLKNDHQLLCDINAITREAGIAV